MSGDIPSMKCVCGHWDTEHAAFTKNVRPGLTRTFCDHCDCRSWTTPAEKADADARRSQANAHDERSARNDESASGELSVSPRVGANTAHEMSGSIPAPVADSKNSLDAAWAAAEAALPDGWTMGGVSRGGSPMQRREWEAVALGPWSRSSRSSTFQVGYGPTPTAALRALAARLTEGTAR